MRLCMMVAAMMLACLSVAADNSFLISNIERSVSALEQRVDIVSGQMDVVSTRIDNNLSNYVATITRKYESQLKGRLSKIDDEIGDAVKDREFYAKRYVELKAAEDRFMCHVNMFWIAMTILVAIVGVFVTWLGIYKPQKSEKQIKLEWEDMREKLNELSSQDMRTVEKLNKTNAEFYFQLAKSVFAQYKIDKSIELLEITVKDLTRSIRYAVEGRDAEGLKSTIAFLNVILSKRVEGDLPEEIAQHRETLVSSLKAWRWDIDEDMVKIVFENSEVDPLHIRYSLSNLKQIMDKYGVRGEA